LEEGIEGLIHVSELSKDKGNNPIGRFKIDDVIQAKVINVSRKDKKIGLSIKKLEELEERDIYKSYLDNDQGATSNLGELLREGISNLERQTLPEDSKSEDSVGEDSVGEDSVGEDSVGEDTVGEDTVGEDTVGELESKESSSDGTSSDIEGEKTGNS
jgi:small subunit ribosomal protein S1